MVRGKALSIARSEHVVAARALGASPLRIVVHHVLPNLAGIVMPLLVGYFLGKDNDFSHALLLIGLFGLVGMGAFLVLLDRIEPIKLGIPVRVHR